MQRLIISICGMAAMLLFTGCATLQGPDATTIDSLPVVKLGDKAPASGEYILFLPLGTDIPVTLTVAGSMIATKQSIQTKVELIKDVYIYKKWSSFDGKTWGDKNIHLSIASGLDTNGGIVNIKVDQIIKK